MHDLRHGGSRIPPSIPPRPPPEPRPAAPASANRPRPRRARRLAAFAVAVLCATYAAGALAVWLVMRLAGERWWPATFLLFSPRWIWSIPLAIVLPLTLLLWRRGLWLPVLTALFVLFGLTGFRVPWRKVLSGSGGTETVRVVTANLHGGQTDPRILDRFLSETDPDVVAFQEYWPGLKLDWLHQPGMHSRSINGLFVASKWPIRLISDEDPGDPRPTAEEEAVAAAEWGNADFYGVEAPAGEFRFVCLHLASPHVPLDTMRVDAALGARLLASNSERRRRESDFIDRRVRQIGGPFLLAGDFNTPDDSPIFRAAWNGLSDAFDTAGFGFGTSYAKHRTWLRIDHILYSDGWRCLTCRTSGDVGSGHHAVFAVFRRTPAGGHPA